MGVNTPLGWLLEPVETKGDVTTGKALAARAPGKQRPYLRTKNVFDGRIVTNDVLTMPMTDAEFERYRVLPGDVLLNEGQSLELVGRCAVYRDENAKPCAMQNQLLRFRARPGVSAEFAAHLFRYSQQEGTFARIALQTTSIAHLGATRLEKLKLLWPEREAEQDAIAEALCDMDLLIESLATLIAKKRSVRRGVMQQLFTGRTRLPGFDGAWESRHVGELAAVSMGQSPPSTSYNTVGDGLPLIQGKADLVGHTTSAQVWTTRPAKRCSEGTIVLTVRAPVGAVARAHAEVCLGRGVCGLSTTLGTRFLYLALQHAESRWAKVQQGSTFLAANADQIAGFAIDVPADPAERTAIAEVLSDMDSELESLEQRLAKTRAIKQGAMQQLLTGRIRLPLDSEGRHDKGHADA